MKKRIFGFVLAAACCINCAANAVSVSDVTQTRNENVISFSGRADSETKKIMVKVYNSLYDETDKNGFVKLSAVEPDKDGNFSFSIVIPENLSDNSKSSGEYIVVFADGFDNKEISFKYLNSEDAADVYKKLRELPENELYSQLGADFGNEAEKVGCDIDTYKKLSESGSRTAVNWFEEQVTKSNDSEMVIGFNKCVYYIYLSEADAELSQSILSKINPVYNGKSFNEYDETDKKYISGYIKKQKLSALADVNTELGKASFLLELKSAKKDELTAMFAENSDLLGLSSVSAYSTYKNLGEETKLMVNEKFLVLAAGGVDDAAKISDLFSSAYSAVVNSNKNGGTSGGNSGGGGKTTSSVPTPGVDAGLMPEKNDEIKDISEAEWAREAIEYCIDKKIVSGYGDGSFRPNNTITREEFVTLLLKAAKLYRGGLEASFTDVEKGAWYEEYVACAADIGLVSGIDSDTFGIGMELTREDMSVIIIRTLEHMGKDLNAVREYETFGDNSEISDYARNAVEKLYCAGLISGMGDGNFSPKGKLTRAQAVKVLYDACCR